MSAEKTRFFEIGEYRFSIISDEPDVFDLIRQPSADRHPDEDLGLFVFQVSKAPTDAGLWSLVGMDGAVLARSTEAEEVVEILNRHLLALSVPQPRSGYHRLALRTVVGRTGNSVLIDPQLIRNQPVIERTFAKAGFGVVDAPFVDVDAKSASVVPLENNFHSESAALVGHIDPFSMGRSKVRAVLWAVDSSDAETRESQTIHSIASSIRNGTRDERVDAAAQLAASVPARLVQPVQKGSLFQALTEFV